jgi:hypothetical protein
MVRVERLRERRYGAASSGLYFSETGMSRTSDGGRVQLKGFTIRWATYLEGGFKEGVSLTCDDELNRWQMYSYGKFSDQGSHAFVVD